jgi:hypothetical protein
MSAIIADGWPQSSRAQHPPSPLLRPMMRSSPSGAGACVWQVGHVGGVPLALPQHTDRTGSCNWGTN